MGENLGRLTLVWAVTAVSILMIINSVDLLSSGEGSGSQGISILETSHALYSGRASTGGTFIGEVSSPTLSRTRLKTGRAKSGAQILHLLRDNRTQQTLRSREAHYVDLEDYHLKEQDD